VSTTPKERTKRFTTRAAVRNVRMVDAAQALIEGLRAILPDRVEYQPYGNEDVGGALPAGLRRAIRSTLAKAPT
jgi:hypothetical protein